MAAPHYLRFARALALVSTAACSETHAPGDDAGPSPVDAYVALDAPATVHDSGPTFVDVGLPLEDAGGDAGTEVADGGLQCGDCACREFPVDGASLPNCYDVGLDVCCLAVGPLSPPDLPA